MTSKVEISHKTIIFAAVFLLGLWLVFLIREILFLVFIAFILMSALRPSVERLVKLRMPRVLAILFLYMLVFGLFGWVLATMTPVIITEGTKLAQLLPFALQRINPMLNIDAQSFTQQIAPLGQNLLRVTVGIFSNILTLLTILAFTFYFLLERKNTEQFLEGIIGESAAFTIVDTLRTIEKRLGAWVQGQLFLMAVIGIMSFIGLTFLGVEFALPLAVLAAVLEIVPVIGPIISAVPAVLIALTLSPVTALSVAALYFIIQLVENNVVVPIVIGRSVGLSPIITIFALLVGGRLAGITGAILAVPIVLVCQVILNVLISHQSKPSKKTAE